ncbi:hypothetical protein GCM10022197_21490 [Microlunatus spumicola]|uniref:Uncharacterized protein n=1 Tax=Microlunatus spumicola TaxID=81499 RepID=A0ABP6XFP2_9ACTN
MQPITSLTDVLDDGAVVSVERQRRLAELLGEGGPYADRWDVDLATGVLRFGGRAGTLETPAHLVGSAAPGPGTWMWGWSNVNGFPPPVVARAAAVRDFGARFGLAELTAPETPLRGEPRQDAVEYAMVAGLVNGGLPHYTADAGNGTVVAFVLDEPQASLPAPSCATAATVIGEALMGGVVNHRRAVTAYAELRGFGLEQAGDEVVLQAGDGRLVVRFDGLGRVASMDARLAKD